MLLRFDREAHTLGLLRSEFYGQVLTLTLALTPPGSRTLIIRALTLTLILTITPSPSLALALALAATLSRRARS